MPLCLTASLEMISFDFEPMVGHLLTRDADCWLSSCVAKRGRVDSAAVRVSANDFAQGSRLQPQSPNDSVAAFKKKGVQSCADACVLDVCMSAALGDLRPEPIVVPAATYNV